MINYLRRYFKLIFEEKMDDKNEKSTVIASKDMISNENINNSDLQNQIDALQKGINILLSSRIPFRTWKVTKMIARRKPKT